MVGRVIQKWLQKWLSRQDGALNGFCWFRCAHKEKKALMSKCIFFWLPNRLEVRLFMPAGQYLSYGVLASNAGVLCWAAQEKLDVDRNSSANVCSCCLQRCLLVVDTQRAPPQGCNFFYSLLLLFFTLITQLLSHSAAMCCLTVCEPCWSCADCVLNALI